jgi:hypothetical protein
MTANIKFSDKEVELINLQAGAGPSIYGECLALVNKYRENPTMELTPGQFGVLHTLKKGLLANA